MTGQASGRPAGGPRPHDLPGEVEWSRWVWLLPGVVILLVAAIVTWLVLAEDDAHELGAGEARLVPAGVAGVEPFAEVDVPAVRQTGIALPPPPARTSVPGDAPGLYAGVRGDARCHADDVGAALTGDARSSWAEVQAIDAGEVDGMLDTLIPVLLRRDTLVTTHRLDGRSAVAEVAVLQRDTAVLVDDRGVPRVRCDGAQPLRPARRRPSQYSFRGMAWLGFSDDLVVRVTAAPVPVERLVLVDPTTGRTFARGLGGVVDSDG